MATLSDLCVACGLCCDGSLFRFVPAKEEERQTWETLGLPLVVQSGQLAMALPCRRLEGKCCSVYAQRPSGCRAYVCWLGKRLEDGKVGFAEALSTVKEAQRRIAVLATEWPVEGPVVQTTTAQALEGRFPSARARVALEQVQSWLDERVHWPE